MSRSEMSPATCPRVRRRAIGGGGGEGGGGLGGGRERGGGDGGGGDGGGGEGGGGDGGGGEGGGGDGARATFIGSPCLCSYSTSFALRSFCRVETSPRKPPVARTVVAVLRGVKDPRRSR